jgi:hypothetical protein
MHISFTLCNQTCLTVQMGNVPLSRKKQAKYLGKHLDNKAGKGKAHQSQKKQTKLEVK